MAGAVGGGGGGWWRPASPCSSACPVIVAALPARPAPVTVEQLADRIAASDRQPYQGFVLGSGIAGLPSLPQVADVIALLNGETKLRAYYAGPDAGGGWTRSASAPSGTCTRRRPGWSCGTSAPTSSPPSSGRRRCGCRAAPTWSRPTWPAGCSRWPRSAAESGRIEALPAKRVAGVAAAGLRLTPTESVRLGRARRHLGRPGRPGCPYRWRSPARAPTEPVLVTRFLDLSLTAPDPVGADAAVGRARRRATRSPRPPRSSPRSPRCARAGCRTRWPGCPARPAPPRRSWARPRTAPGSASSWCCRCAGHRASRSLDRAIAPAAPPSLRPAARDRSRRGRLVDRRVVSPPR